MTLFTLSRIGVLSGALALGLSASAQEASYIPGDLLVMLEPGASAQTVADDLRIIDGQASHLRVVKEVSAPMRTWLLHYEAPGLAQELVRRSVDTHPAVRFAQNNHIVKDRALPNDDEFAEQWQHINIDSQEAWDITTGGVTATNDTIVVAIIENADLPHPDLIGNAWFNHHEIPGNNVDDDGNGYVDDFQGWNPAGDDDAVYGGSHGTQVAGMIGAKGNNGSQVVGANWDVKMMPVTHEGTSEDGVVAAYTYPLVMRRLYNQTGGAQGAFVVATNASWGIDYEDHTQHPIWCAMYDTLGTAGILNCGATANNNVDIDEVDDMPTGCESPYMVSVTATNAQDLRTFSGYGATTVDLGAPGENIFTTSIGGGTGSTSGTSFASPLTAGIIGLLYSAPCSSLMDLVNADPQQGALYVRQALFNGVEQVGNLPGNCVTGGRVNSFNSLEWIMSHCGACPAPYYLHSTSTTIGSATLQWSSLTSSVFNVRYRPVGEPDWISVNDVADTLLDVTDLTACTAYEFQVEGQCDPDSSGFSDSEVFTSEGCCSIPAFTATALDTSGINVQWNGVLAADNYDLRYSLAGTGQWTVVPGATGVSTSITGLEGCNDYEVQMRSNCDGTTTDWGTSALVHVPGCGSCIDVVFCPSEGANSAYEWIDRVQLNTLDNESGNDGGYFAYTGLGTTLAVGQAYPITLTPGFPGNGFEESWSVWIDLDVDGQFEAPEEQVFEALQADAVVTGDLVVPDGSPFGPTRMRVVMKFGNPVADGCVEQFGFGEVEDYCITLSLNEAIADAADGSGMRLFPNPADHELFFELPVSNSAPAVIEVLDNSGRTIARTIADQRRSIMNTSGLPNGLYLFRLMRDGAPTFHGKFEVAHD